MVEDDEPSDDLNLERLTPRQQPAGRAVQRNRLAVYVYELPTWLNLAYEIDRFEWESERFNMYSSYRIALSRLLHDWDVRTLNPYEANLFYVPAFVYGLLSNGGVPHEWVRRVIRWLQAEYPLFWNRNGGSDHVFWYTGDRGVCPMPEDLRNIIWLTHYGQSNYTYSMDPDPKDVGPCFDITRDIVPPPYIDDADDFARDTYGAERKGQRPPRETLLFFSGGLRPHMPYYSQGVRQRVYELYHDRPGFRVAEGSIGSLKEPMQSSVFCLAPAGHGWGNRIVYAMVTGCIPVIVQDGIHQPYDDLLPYHEFAVRVAQKDVGALEELLRAIPHDEVSALQRGVQRYHRAFIWGAPGAREGDAYEMLVRALERRLYNIRSNIIAGGRRRRLLSGGDGAA